MDTFFSYEPFICHLGTCDKFVAINEVIDRCTIFHDLLDLDRFKRAVKRREQIETTGIGHGVAIAHGKIIHLDHIKVGLGLANCQGVDYNAKDNMPVTLLFVIASTPSRQLEYIKTLSAILRSVRDDSLREELLSMPQAVIDGTQPPTGSPQFLAFLQMLSEQQFIHREPPACL